MRTWADVGLLVALGAAVWLLIRLLPRRAAANLALYAIAAAITSAGAVAIGVRREHRGVSARSVAVTVAGMCVVWLLAWTQRPRGGRVTTATATVTATATPAAAAPADDLVPMTRRERREAAQHHWFRRRRSPAPATTRAREEFDPEPA